MLIGIQGAGKSTHAKRLEAEGAVRLSRDEMGGTLKRQLDAMTAALKPGGSHVILDNTYTTRVRRSHVIEAAWQCGASVEAIWCDTPLGEAQINVVDRILAEFGELLDPEGMKAAAKTRPNVVPPRVLFQYESSFEPPSEEEGFARLERRVFRRSGFAGHNRSGLIVPLELALAGHEIWRARRPDEPVLVLGWVPGATEAMLAQTRDNMPSDVELACCPHPPGPPVCWCRKPLPGLAVRWLRRNRIDPKATRYVGAKPADRTLAKRLGCEWVPFDDKARR